MHAQPLPRKPIALKQALAGLVLTSFLIKHGEWTAWRMTRAYRDGDAWRNGAIADDSIGSCIGRHAHAMGRRLTMRNRHGRPGLNNYIRADGVMVKYKTRVLCFTL